MTELFINYKRSLEKFGKPQGGGGLQYDLISFYRDHLPDTYLEFLMQCGTGKWLQGYFQLCDPKKYQSVLKLVLEGERDFKPERTHCIGFSAFGELVSWNEDYRVLRLDILNHRAACGYFFKPKPNIGADITLGGAVGNVEDQAYDLPDQDGNPMFKRLLKACGELELGQIYAPKLHPALGGEIKVDNFRPADALAAMTIAAQTGPFTLYDTTKPNVPAVRIIGE